MSLTSGSVSSFHLRPSLPSAFILLGSGQKFYMYFGTIQCFIYALFISYVFVIWCRVKPKILFTVPVLLLPLSQDHGFCPSVTSSVSGPKVFFRSFTWNILRNQDYILFCINFGMLRYGRGARGSVLGWDTMLQVGRSQDRFPMGSLDFSIDLILPAAL
jgi:hypothetical protein